MFRTESSCSNTIAVHDFRFDLLIKKKLEFRDYAMNHGSLSILRHLVSCSRSLSMRKDKNKK